VGLIVAVDPGGTFRISSLTTPGARSHLYQELTLRRSRRGGDGRCRQGQGRSQPGEWSVRHTMVINTYIQRNGAAHPLITTEGSATRSNCGAAIGRSLSGPAYHREPVGGA